MAEEIIAPVTPTVNEGGQPAKEPEKKMLTQAEIDAIIEDRLVRDRTTREQSLAKDLGMTLKEAKALIKAKKDADEANKTAQEKLAEELEATKKALKNRDLRDTKRAKVESLISEKKIKLPDGASIADVLDLVTGEDENGINESLVKLPKLFPFSAPGMPGVNPANPGSKAPDLDEQIAAAEASGNWNLATSLKIKKQRGK